MMLRSLVLGTAVFLSLTGVAQAEKRCGWNVNPTPGNWWLNDKDGQWTISAQGGFQAKGMNRLPDLTGKQWIVTNGTDYGYGCACVTGKTDAANAQNLRFVAISKVKQRSLTSCKSDKGLAAPY